MGEVIRRHVTALALAGYVAAALLSAATPLLMSMSEHATAIVFTLESLLLGAAGVVLWQMSHRRISTMAYRDDLTTLANRRAFNERAETFGREDRGGSRSLVLFDVDGLKEINEHCGHQAGDELLSLVGRRINEIPGNVYRIGGDEFAALVDRAGGESALPILRKLEPFRSEFASCGHAHSVSLSYGFASALPGEDFAGLFRRADDRLRQFKRELYASNSLPERRTAPLVPVEQPAPDMPDGPVPGKKARTGRGRLRLLG